MFSVAVVMSQHKSHQAALPPGGARCQTHHGNLDKWALCWNCIQKFNYEIEITGARWPPLKNSYYLRLEAKQENFCPSASPWWQGSNADVKVLRLAQESALILCLQEKDVSVLLPGIASAACVGWHCLCGFWACGLRVLPLLSHCSSCGGALGRRRGRREQQRIDHHVDGRSGLSTGHRVEERVTKFMQKLTAPSCCVGAIFNSTWYQAGFYGAVNAPERFMD